MCSSAPHAMDAERKKDQVARGPNEPDVRVKGVIANMLGNRAYRRLQVEDLFL